MYWRGANRELLFKGATLKDPNFRFRSVSTSVIPSRPGWSRKSIPFVWISPGQKKMGPNHLFLAWCIWSLLIWLSIKIMMTFLGFCKIQVPDPASRELWWHQQSHISCYNLWKIREKKNGFRPLKWL